MNPYNAIGSFLVGNLSKSLIQNLFWKTNSPIRGSIVYCDLAFGTAEHSGVYVGNGRIIHRNGNGLIEDVSVNQFLTDTTAISIYISCNAQGSAVGSESCAQTAEGMLGVQTDYSLLNENCHQFCSYCLDGDIFSSTFTLTQLKRDAHAYIQASQWRVWDLRHRHKG
ncbi:lecithin retinol acyltransferase family protein [Vibrio intestinalis]|uniref:lecithin retinol acyltransferase family protein n=1 Tax=Vibrio intestinalis TaxID=2933291 RepID=UPI002559CF3C|nr:lecithin retinol acyltransferase family protein [Vibrio intestinalis]